MKTLIKLLPLFIVMNTQYLATAQGTNDYDDIYYSEENDPSYGTNQKPADKYQEDGEYKTMYDANQNDNADLRTAPDYSTTDSYVDETGDTYVTNNYYYDEEVYDEDDYYDYSYASRLRRFHNPINGFSYYDAFYTNSYWYSYNPFDYGLSIYLGYPWWGFSYGWRNPYRGYWGNMSCWYGYGNGWGFGGYGNGWGYGGFGNGWGYGGFGYGGYWSGYNNGYWNGYNDGVYDGYYGYNNPYYYNSYDGTNYYYGPRNSTASNSPSTGGSISELYETQYGPGETRFTVQESTNTISEIPTSYTGVGKNTSTTGVKAVEVSKPTNATGKSSTYEQPVSTSPIGKSSAPAISKSQPTSVTSGSKSQPTSATGTSKPNTYSSGSKSGSYSKGYNTAPSRTYNKPASTVKTNSYSRPSYNNTKQQTGSKTYNYNKSKSYSKSSPTREYAKPKTTTKTTYSRPKTSNQKPSYSQPKKTYTSKPSYSRPQSSGTRTTPSRSSSPSRSVAPSRSSSPNRSASPSRSRSGNSSRPR